MLKVFKDDALQAAMERDGFVVVPFYTNDEVEYLLQQFYELHQSDVSGFFSSTFSFDTHYREKANEVIMKVCQRAMEELLLDYKAFCACYLVKASDDNSALCVHQDMSLVDERVFSGFNIWVPLIDLNETNGPLQVLPGSHRIYPTLRGSTIPGIYEETDDYLRKYLKTLYLHAGQAVIFDQSIIHASPNNVSGKLRPVTNTFFTHKDARIRICYYEKSLNKIELFDEEDSFMTEYVNFGYDIHSRPSIGTSLGYVDYDFPKLTKEQLDQIYADPNAVEETETTPVKTSPKKKSFLRKLLNI
ncbi:MAG: phytanoyl-CoA dioxygenase family protein [Chitinophagales bacterium]|nr:phytanoyl-CoA dioxygenase family protein [Chitinophagales bacterium]